MTAIDIEDACPTCKVPVGQDNTIPCPHCGALYHKSCWQANGNKCIAEQCTGTVWDLLPTQEDPENPETVPPPLVRSSFNGWVIGISIALFLVGVASLAIALGVPHKLVLIIGVVVCALAFDYVNGMHDAGNAIATVISTRVLTPATALIMAAVLNLAGALIHTGVAKSIAMKFAAHSVTPTEITLPMILCGLIGASSWSYITARIGLPVSTSHSLFGGLIGVFLVAHIPLNDSYLGQLALFMVVAPVSAFIVGWLLMVILNAIFRNVAPYKLNKHFRVWQVFSSALMAFSHGSNDAQKAMGIITMALASGSYFSHQVTIHWGSPMISQCLTWLVGADGHGDINVPPWVKIACALVIALGTGFGGMRVIQTLGHKIIKLAPIHGFAAEAVAAATIQIVTLKGIPISTTHVISSSILGIGASRRLSAVRWGVAGNIIAAWLFTIPTCALASALLFWLVQSTGLERLVQ